MKNVGSIVATAVAVLIVGWWLPGCGGSGSSSSGSVSSGTIVVNGVANLGVVSGAVVNAYRLDGGSKGALLDSYAATDSYGQYALKISNYQGPMLLELVQNAKNSAQFKDESSGLSKVLASTIRSVVPAPSADQYANITALTEVATLATLQKLSQAGADPRQSVMEALAQVGTAFLAGVSPLTVRPDDVAQAASGSADRSQYASVLAGFSGLAASNKVTIAQLAADFYGQMFPQVGAPYAQASPYTDALFSQMNAVVTNAVVTVLPKVKAKPLGTADIAAAHQGIFDFARLTLSSAQGSDNLSIGSMDFYASVNTALKTVVTERAAYNNGATVAVGGVVNYYGHAQQDGSWDLRNAASATSPLFQQGAMSGNGTWIAGVTTDIYNVGSHHLMLAVARPATAVVLNSIVGDWDWIAVEKNGTSTITWNGFLTVSAAGFIGQVTYSNQSGAKNITGNITSVAGASSEFLITNKGSNAFMPQTFHFIPTADAYTALVYFSDGTNWGEGVALRRNLKILPLSGRLYHYSALDMVGKNSTSGMANLLSQRLTGKTFSSVLQRPSLFSHSITITWPALIANGPQTITVVDNGQSLSGFVASDGSAVVVEDPGNGIRLLLRQ